MLATLRRTLERGAPIARGAHVLVAVSGGADSTALAVALAECGARFDLRLTLAHLHHGLRGRAADEDARRVAALARRLGLPLILGRRDVARLARRRKLSLEMAAREARYDFLRAAARRAGAECAATAHTADDQAETVLMRWARGTGGAGLAGIPERSEWRGCPVARPMLGVTRRQVEAFLRSRQWDWREDESNRDPRHLRNRVRHEVLPMLERRLNPRAREALARWAAIAGEEESWMNDMARRLLLEPGAMDPDGGLNLAPLRALAPAAVRRVLRIWLARHGTGGQALDYEAIERVRGLLGSTRGSCSVTLSGGRRVVREYGRLRCARAGAPGGAYRQPLAVPGTTRLGDTGWRVVAERGTGFKAPAGVPPMEAWLDAARVGRARLIARSRRPGDAYRPLGLAGTKKVQDLWVDARLPRAGRMTLPVFECRGELVWAPGGRVAQDWAVRSAAARSVQLKLDRVPPGNGVA